MQILKINPENFKPAELESAVSTLKCGGVLAYPTETVYGLGANIYHQKAVQRIFQLKKRDAQKAVSVMIGSFTQVEELCVEISELGKRFMNLFWPGPLTLIFKASAQAPNYILGPDQKIGLRMPDHPITRALMKLHRDPVTSTSANISGFESPVRASAVAATFGNAIDMLIDGGECSGQVPSSVLDVSGKEPIIIREGAISFKQIENSLQGVE